MTRSKVIKEVAKTLSQQSELSDNVMPYLADHFTKSELKLLGKFLRLEIKKRKVVIVTSVQLQPEHKKKPRIILRRTARRIYSRYISWRRNESNKTRYSS